MIHIKVIRASHLALGLAIAALVIVLLLFALQWAFTRAESEPSHAAEAAVVSAVRPLSGESDGAPDMGSGSDTTFDAPDFSRYADRMEVTVVGARKRVLIYHTHTHEAFEQTLDDPYVETAAWRTADPDYSVVRVGELLTELLRAAGCEVVHDQTDHEMNEFQTAYERSLETLLSYTEPFDLYVDLHRNAYLGSGSDDSLALTARGTRYARLMMLVGMGTNFRVKPDYERNRAFAQTLTDRLNAALPGLCQDVMSNANRYNQHVGSPAILVEVGHNRNSLDEALASMPYLADAISGALSPEQAGALPLANDP